MFIALRKRARRGFVLGCVSGAALLALAVGQASAATYPGGGSTFTGSAEGWKAGSECKALNLLPVLCTGTAGYDATIGSPPGSLAATTEIPVNLVGFFKSDALLESPNFTATGSGAGSLALSRQFEPGGLRSLSPVFTYTTNLVDKTVNTKQKAITETLEGVAPFAVATGGVTLIAGHTYAVQIEASDSSSVAAVGLLGGSAVGRFDNVVVTGPDAPATPGGNPGSNGANGGFDGGGNSEAANGGGGSAGGVSSARLVRLIKSSSLVGRARLKGNRLSVKAKCPAKVGAICTLSLQGMLNRHKVATARRRARVRKGKVKNFALVVRPAARRVVRKRKKLLFKETVRAGKAKATVYRSLRLVRK